MRTTTNPGRLLAMAAAGALLLGACGDDDPTGTDTTPTTAAAAEPVVDPGDGGHYAPELDPADFVDSIDNPYFPLIPGTKWVYEGEDDGEVERVEVEVLDET